MDISELTRQAPGIVGVIVVVYAFLSSQTKQHAAFAESLKEKDAAYIAALAALAEEVAGLGKLFVSYIADQQPTKRKATRRKNKQ